MCRQTISGAALTLLARCNGLTLSEPQKSNTSFYLQVMAPGKDYDLAFVQASGNEFWVGGTPSTYCPSDAIPGLRCPNDTSTVFYSNSLAVSVPGGQRIFIQEDGTLAFSVAHSASEPKMAHDGENVAYRYSGYFGPDGAHWAACMPWGSTWGRRRIVADLPGVDLSKQDCESIFLYVNNDLPSGMYIDM